MHEFKLTDVWRTRNIGVKHYTWLRVCDDRICGARLIDFYFKKIWNNKVMDVCISPNGFSDHHMVILVLNVKKTLKSNTYWHLNVKILHDSCFCENVKAFWNNWKLKKLSFENLGQWWDVGNVNKILFCQNYTIHTSTMVKTTVTTLQKEIQLLEKHLEDNTERVHGDVLNKKKQELSSLLKEQAKGALIRAKFCSIKDKDALSIFFLILKETVCVKNRCATFVVRMEQ